MKQEVYHNRYDPPRLEFELVTIEIGFNVSFVIDAEDWQDGGGGNLNTE